MAEKPFFWPPGGKKNNVAFFGVEKKNVLKKITNNCLK